MSIKGVEVTTEVTIANPSHLGHHIAAMGSDEQAQVIAGFAVGVDALGAVGLGDQLLWIAESLSGHPDRAVVIETLTTLLIQTEALRVGPA